MNPRRWTWRVGLLGLAVFSGCQEPPEIIPATLPGVAPPPPALPAGSEAQAIGEQRLPSPTPEPNQALQGTAPAPSAQPTAKGEVRTTPSGLRYETLTPGTGAEAKPGQRLTVHYTGTLADGTTFDSSRPRGEPFSFTLGQREVIPGWDEGVAGMKVGERRQLTIPAELGYGAEGFPPKIPPNATLTFDVELLDAR